MGQCVSRRTSTVISLSTPIVAQNSNSKDSDSFLLSPNDEKQSSKKPPLTKGVAMSFGFRKKPPGNTFTGNPAAARRLAANDTTVDKNGNDDVSSIPPSGRSTPKLVPPKKEPHAARVSRFGFRQPNNNRLNKIADVRAPIQPSHVEYNVKNDNNNMEVTKPKVTFSQSVLNDNIKTDNNKSVIGLKQPTKFTLQSSNLPKPQYPVRVMETKTAKTLANTNTKKMTNQKKIIKNFEEEVLRDEDSGVSSQETDSKSPTTSEEVRKPRSLEIILKNNTFDVKDVDVNSTESDLPIPRLPTAFDVQINTGIVRERANEYEKKHLVQEKTFTSIGRFLKSNVTSDSTSGSSSDDQWTNAAGEAMAEDFNLEAKVRTKTPEDQPFEELIQNSFGRPTDLLGSFGTIEDSKFAAIVEASNSSKLLQDEPSPTESIYSYSESEELKQKNNDRRNSSNSKDICEKSTNSSPGTPTNASNSLSLSDGKDFLIDDEIADQPALVFDDNNQQASENNTLVESTPKVRRKGLEQSPLFLKSRKKLFSRSDSVETLSTCESIASDDLMLDFEVSQDDRFELKSCDDVLGTAKDAASMVVQLDRQLAKRASRTTRLLRSRGSTPDSMRSLESRCNGVKSHSSVSQSPLRLQSPRILPSGYDSDDSSIKIHKSRYAAIEKETMDIKTMLLKLKRVLQESETRNAFETQPNGGLFNGLSVEDQAENGAEPEELKRQVLFLQGQVEDRDKLIQQLQEQVRTSNSAPASTVCVETSNAATQTERARTASAGPSILGTSSAEGNSVVSANEGRRIQAKKRLKSHLPRSTNTNRGET